MLYNDDDNDNSDDDDWYDNRNIIIFGKTQLILYRK